jgi:hypothetical protein
VQVGHLNLNDLHQLLRHVLHHLENIILSIPRRRVIRYPINEIIVFRYDFLHDSLDTSSFMLSQSAYIKIICDFDVDSELIRTDIHSFLILDLVDVRIRLDDLLDRVQVFDIHAFPQQLREILLSQVETAIDLNATNRGTPKCFNPNRLESKSNDYNHT